MYALKAAEKVGNLSDELDKLSLFLQQELDAEDYQSKDHELLAKELRMEGAIHIIQTLKSVNDKSLSDWQGVIGEEINEQREKREEREADLRDLADRIESLYSTQLEDLVSAQDENAAFLGAQIESIKGELSSLASQAGVPVRGRRMYVSTEPNTVVLCPTCAHPIQYRQKLKAGTSRSITCPACEAKLVSTCDGLGFKAETRRPVPEEVSCPNCASTMTVQLDNLPNGTSALAVCAGCNLECRVTRTKTGVKVKPIANPDLDFEKVVSLVRDALPEQPWPKGTSRDVAARLGVPLAKVSQAITELIQRGDFLPQVDGRLFVPMVGDSSSDERPSDDDVEESHDTVPAGEG